MSDITITCPSCNQQLEVPQDLLGQVVECPACEQSVQLPDPARQPAQSGKKKVVVRKRTSASRPGRSTGRSSASASKSPQISTGAGVAIVLGIIVVGVVGGLLSSSDSGSSSSRPNPSSKPTRPQYQFERASHAQIEKLKYIQEEDKRIADTVFAVRSQHHKNVWYVSTKIYGPGLENGVSAVWSMSGAKGNPGMILAADTTADEFTPVPYMNDTKAGTGLGMDPEARALENYVQKNVK